MEKTTNERETHDFMNVESFSQLPFIRPAPVKEKGGIRLFGKEFGAADSTASTDNESNSAETTTNNNNNNNNNANCDGIMKSNDNNGESSRKFECHYCCRNFPTSQALGGHQNAHKRERQHAKRAHLQSAMIHGGLSEAHAYGFINYPHRLGSAPSPSPMAYPSWSRNAFNNNTTTTNRLFYGSGHGGSFSQPPPINGSPLGLWRTPPVHNPTFLRDHSLNPVQLFSSDELKPSLTGSATPQNRFGYESKAATMQDHVSLDLRL